jgi:hypothetical protein
MSVFTAADEVGRGREGPSLGIVGTILGAAVALGLVTASLGTRGPLMSLFALAAVVLVVVLWRNPALSPIVVLALALTVEQFPFSGIIQGGLAPAPTPSDMTDRIPLFRAIAPGVRISPADLILLVLLAFWALKRGTTSTRSVPRSAISLCFTALLLAVAVGVVVGQAHHGSLRTAFTEVRPFAYLAIAYLVASVFATRLEVIHLALWALVLGSGLKAFQALYSFMHVRHQNPRPDFVVGHEEALFFALFVLLTVALWLFELPGRLRTTATALLPIVLVADLVNSRRAAWLILGGGLIALTAVSMVAVPARRRFLTRILAILAVVSVFYFPAYWNHEGALAGPARAVQSAVSPNARDQLSDAYRFQENENLLLNIRAGGIVGRGFGVPINYAPGSILDLSSIDPLIAYVPHNGVLYIPMRIGLFGSVAFWSLLGIGIIGACRLARSRDREVALFGVLVSCALVGYALEGYNDQGFFWYRIAFVMGTLLGLAEAARVLDGRVTVSDTIETTTSGTAPKRPSRAATRSALPRHSVLRKPERAEPSKAEKVRVEMVGWIARWGARLLLPIAIGFFIWLIVAPP